jgi:hypothetical protein
VARLFDPDDVDLRTDREAAVELYQRRNGLLLVNRASDLRCGVVPLGDRIGSGFDRPGVLVVATTTHDAVSIGVTTSEDLDASIASRRRSDRTATRPDAWALGLARHREHTSELIDVAAGIVRAELSRCERVRLDAPPRNLGIFEAPRWVMQSGKLVALAFRAIGCDLGPAVPPPHPVEHPDLWNL